MKLYVVSDAKCPVKKYVRNSINAFDAVDVDVTVYRRCTRREGFQIDDRPSRTQTTQPPAPHGPLRDIIMTCS